MVENKEAVFRGAPVLPTDKVFATPRGEMGLPAEIPDPVQPGKLPPCTIGKDDQPPARGDHLAECRPGLSLRLAVRVTQEAALLEGSRERLRAHIALKDDCEHLAGILPQVGGQLAQPSLQRPAAKKEAAMAERESWRIFWENTARTSMEINSEKSNNGCFSKR